MSCKGYHGPVTSVITFLLATATQICLLRTLIAVVVAAAVAPCQESMVEISAEMRLGSMFSFRSSNLREQGN